MVKNGMFEYSERLKELDNQIKQLENNPFALKELLELYIKRLEFEKKGTAEYGKIKENIYKYKIKVANLNPMKDMLKFQFIADKTKQFQDVKNAMSEYQNITSYLMDMPISLEKKERDTPKINAYIPLTYIGIDGKEINYSEEGYIVLNDIRYIGGNVALALQIATEEDSEIIDYECEKNINLLLENNIISQDRKESYEVILQYWYYGNNIVLAHLLPAQIEACLLLLLQDDGCKTGSFNEDGNLVGSVTLGVMLNNHYNQLTEIFQKKSIDYKILRAFKVILIDFRVRDSIYHGKVQDIYLQSTNITYLGFLFMMFLLQQLPDNNKKNLL